MIKYRFKINFFWKGHQNNSLYYNLYDNNAAVDDFVKAVKAGSDVPVYSTSMCFTKSETVNKYCELYQQAKKLLETDIYNDTIGKIDPECILDGWNQDTLNYLHNYVEEYEILIDKISDTENRWLGPLISKFNDNIHNLENDRVGYDGSWLGFRMEPFQKIPIRDEHMELFKPGYRKRKLYLGYSEIGKTLWHMYEANDVQAAERKQSNPKAHITNEIMLPYFNANWDWEKYCNWCEQHAQGVDHIDPRQWGQIEIGTLVDPYAYQIKPFDKIEVELEE